ncbi:hypothetical protein EG832_12140, partial [bacterium]|nr:hypothetical protein [bacterium]
MRSKPNIRNRYVLLFDLVLMVFSVLGAYALRLEMGALFYFYLKSAYWMIGVSLILKTIVYYAFGMYRRMWVYASIKELRLIIGAVTTASVLVTGVMIFIST